MARLELWPYQKDAVDSIFRYFSNSAIKVKGNPLVVAPTGSGKSLIIAEFIKIIHESFPAHRTLVLSHVKELIDQNAKKLAGQWPEAPIGIYHAGLKKRQIGRPIMYAGIQSIHRKPELVGHIDLILIDEAHMLSPNNQTTYRQFINALKEINPKLKVIGFTATPFRTGTGGCLISGKNPLFTDFCCNIKLKELVENNYLSPLNGHISKTQLIWTAYQFGMVSTMKLRCRKSLIKKKL